MAGKTRPYSLKNYPLPLLVDILPNSKNSAIASNFDENQGALRIQTDGQVFLN